ncbi:hypothetical protein [Bacillus pseudomycoides]|uniref:hypothetical protein n=1 Tax=Bacillus pseudomycoides TaxID=64104 RepID=UPI000BEC1A1A|nr:hypothetical protein [Bacillus pseudomycoides]PDY47460.1 hypothetical protein CON79_09380 [Bacillus pseudomycoides]
MKQELGFTLKVEDILGDLEVELREICDNHEDVYSNEHIQMKELLKKIIETKKDVVKIGGNLIPPSEFDL